MSTSEIVATLKRYERDADSKAAVAARTEGLEQAVPHLVKDADTLRAAAARLDELERENAALRKERDYAVKWGNRSLDSVKEVMWRYEDALNLIGNSLVCAPTDYAEHNASELLRAGNIARAALAGSGEK